MGDRLRSKVARAHGPSEALVASSFDRSMKYENKEVAQHTPRNRIEFTIYPYPWNNCKINSMSTLLSLLRVAVPCVFVSIAKDLIYSHSVLRYWRITVNTSKWVRDNPKYGAIDTYANSSFLLPSKSIFDAVMDSCDRPQLPRRGTI